MNKTLILSTAALVAAPAFAADWSFYGSARVSTFGEAVIDTGDGDTKTSNSYKLQPNSRFGANAKDGNLGGTFEAGIGQVVTNAATGKTTNALVLRKLFGTWQIDDKLQLLIGQDFTPINYANSNQAWGSDNNLYGWGVTAEGRLPQVRLSGYGASIALLNGRQTAIKAGSGTDTASYAARPANTPKIELAYDQAFGSAHAGLGLAFNRYRLDATRSLGSAYESAYSVNNFVGTLDLSYKTDLLKVAASASYALNSNELGLAAGNPFKARIDSDGELVNTSSLLGYVTASLSATPAIVPEVGAGFENHSQDFGDETASDTRLAFYGQVSLSPAKKVAIVPEIGVYLESGEDKNGESYDKPTIVYYGAKSQISF